MNKGQNERTSRTEHSSSQEKPFQQKMNEDLQENIKNATQAGKHSLAQEVSNFGAAVQSAATKLHQQNDYFAGWADIAANKIDDASRYLEDKNTGEIVSAFGDFSRKNPYIMIGGMFVAGLTLSRFVKAGI